MGQIGPVDQEEDEGDPGHRVEDGTEKTETQMVKEIQKTARRWLDQPLQGGDCRHDGDDDDQDHPHDVEVLGVITGADQVALVGPLAVSHEDGISQAFQKDQDVSLRGGGRE